MASFELWPGWMGMKLTPTCSPRKLVAGPGGASTVAPVGVLHYYVSRGANIRRIHLLCRQIKYLSLHIASF